MRGLIRIGALSVLPFLLLPPLGAAVIHVPADQPSIQAGMNAAVNGDTVLVADGTWSGPGNRNLEFEGKAITVASAGGPGNCIIDLGGDENWGFVLADWEDYGSVVSGFTIRNGLRGIFCYSSPAIVGNVFTGCDVGIEIYDRSPLITGNTIKGCLVGISGHFIDYGRPVITGNTIIDNSSNGVSIYDDYGQSEPKIVANIIEGNGFSGVSASGHTNLTVTGNTITGNDWSGVNLIGGEATGTIEGNVITGNSAERGGGVYLCAGGVLRNNLIMNNQASDSGGGIHADDFAVTITNCTVVGNSAGTRGGGLCFAGGLDLVVASCIFRGNQAPAAAEIYAETRSNGSELQVCYSNISGGVDGIVFEPGWGQVDLGPGLIDADPLFVSGPQSDHYLSQVAAGQGADSPCVDTGNPVTPLIEGTTRTDHVLDSGIIDMGFHYLEPPPQTLTAFLATGPGPAMDSPPLVRVFPPEEWATHMAQWTAYGADSFGVNVTTGDVDGDGSSEVITGAGPGAIYGPHVRAFTPRGYSVDNLNFLAYGTNKFGVNVACGDLDGDSRDEIITGAGPGAVFGPHVRGWNYDGTAVTPISGISFFAYGTPKWGVNVAAGDIDGDGFDEIVTGPGPGDIYGPHVRGWDTNGGTIANIPEVSYLAYGTNKKGVRVTCGDVDGDGIEEIVTAPGPSPVFGAHIRGWDYDGIELVEIPGINFIAWGPEESLFGATVSALADLNGDGRNEIIVGQGPDTSVATPIKTFSYDGSATSLLFGLDAYGDSGLTHGANAAVGIQMW